MLATLTHNELASSLAAHLRSRACDHRVTWENLEFADYCSAENFFRCRPDVFSIYPTLNVQKCRPWSHEVKVSRADFLSDLRSGKWKQYNRFSSRVFFAAPRGLIEATELPAEAGLWEYDGKWSMTVQAKIVRGWELTSKHLMKLILGRWGTFAGNLPASSPVTPG